MRGLYVITDDSLSDEVIIQKSEETLKGGTRILQLRDKKREDDEVYSLAHKLQSLCKAHKALFVIDDRLDLVKRIDADGLHIGKEDVSYEEARKILPDKIIGVSCYGSVKKAKEMQEKGADYVAFGSFFPSKTKPKSGVVSLDVIKRAKEELSIPVCAIGGIDQSNIEEVVKRGADMISIISAVMREKESQKVTEKLISLLKKGENNETTNCS